MKEIDKYILEKKSEKILVKEHVTTMSYDLEVKDDTNINQEIKDYLIGKEWNFTIPERRVIPYLGKERTEKDADTPHTTAWKEGVTPKEAINEFCAAIEAYNTNHALDTPVKLGRGNAFAVKDNEYDKKYYYLLPAVIAECGGTGTGNYRQCNHRQRKYTDDKAEADGAA